MSFEQPIEQSVIHADGFVVRPVRMSDAGRVALYASDERVARGTTIIPHPLPEGATEALIERALAPDRDEDVWVIDPSVSQDEVLGAIMMKRLDREQSEIGFWVAPQAWNNGLASKAVEAVVAANPQASKTIFAAVFQDNPASGRVLTNSGFAYIGDAESFSVSRNSVVPTWTYIRNMG